MFSISNAAGASTSNAIFTVIPAPAVTGFNPQGGPVGAEITVTGSNFTTVTAVSFNGVSAPGFIVQSNSLASSEMIGMMPSNSLRRKSPTLRNW